MRKYSAEKHIPGFHQVLRREQGPFGKTLVDDGKLSQSVIGASTILHFHDEVRSLRLRTRPAGPDDGHEQLDTAASPPPSAPGIPRPTNRPPRERTNVVQPELDLFDKW
jgi:hypothetical protein